MKLCDDQKFDYENGELDKIPAYCVIGEWHRRERTAHALAPLSAVVYVQRGLDSAPDRTQDFDVYRGGADLRTVPITIAADGTLTAGASTSLTAGCGLDPKTADIRRPQVSWDGAQVAFAARASGNEPLAVYTMKSDDRGAASKPTSTRRRRRTTASPSTTSIRSSAHRTTRASCGSCSPRRAAT
jgi:hypothetical protein